MDDDGQGYPLAQRAAAVLGLLVLAGIAFILADVASGGRITGRPCDGCEEPADG